VNDVIVSEWLDYGVACSVADKVSHLTTLPYIDRIKSWFEQTQWISFWISDELEKAALVRATAKQLDEFETPKLSDAVRMFDWTQEVGDRTPIDFLMSKNQRVYSAIPRTHADFISFWKCITADLTVQEAKNQWLERVESLSSLKKSYLSRMKNVPSPEQLLNSELLRFNQPGLPNLQPQHIGNFFPSWEKPRGISDLESEGRKSEDMQVPIEKIFPKDFGATYREVNPGTINDLGYLLATVEVGRIKAVYSAFLLREAKKVQGGSDLREEPPLVNRDGLIIASRTPSARHWAFFIKALAEAGELMDDSGTRIQIGENHWKERAFELYKSKMKVEESTFKVKICRELSKLINPRDAEDVLTVLMLAEKKTQHLNIIYKKILAYTQQDKHVK
jgi:hypothetical protein